MIADNIESKDIVLSLALKIADVGASCQNFSTAVKWANKYYSELSEASAALGDPAVSIPDFHRAQFLHLDGYVRTIVSFMRKTDIFASVSPAIEENLNANYLKWQVEGFEIISEWVNSRRNENGEKLKESSEIANSR